MKNIVLIGMPGAGKSTVGVILAKVLGYKFIDSDLLIQEQEKMLLKDIIARDGLQGFTAIENQVNRDIITDRSVIATGGSIIYCTEAMEHLKEIGIVVYLKLSYETIADRLDNIKQRGVVFKEGESLRNLYDKRCPVYEKYADLAVDGEGLDTEDFMDRIVNEINKLSK